MRRSRRSLAQSAQHGGDVAMGRGTGDVDRGGEVGDRGAAP